MRWVHPEWLYGLGVLLLLAGCDVWLAHWRKKARIRMAQPPFHALIFPNPRPTWFRRSLWYGALLVLLLALARPQGAPIQQLQPDTGLDWFMVLDCSLSMQAQDLPSSRLAAGKALLEALLESRPGDRVGLIVFAGEARLLCPLTRDHAALRLALKQAQPGLFAALGSNPAAGVQLALEKLTPVVKENPFILLLSDGEVNSGPSLEDASLLAKARGILIMTIGLGTLQGSPIPMGRDFWGKLQYCQYQGKIVQSRLNSLNLEKAARNSGGQYFAWAPGQAMLRQLFHALNSRQQQKSRLVKAIAYREFFPGLCLLAWIALWLETFMPKQKEPSRAA